MNQSSTKGTLDLLSVRFDVLEEKDLRRSLGQFLNLHLLNSVSRGVP